MNYKQIKQKLDEHENMIFVVALVGVGVMAVLLSKDVRNILAARKYELETWARVVSERTNVIQKGIDEGKLVLMTTGTEIYVGSSK